MGKPNASLERITQMRESLGEFMFPQTCRMYPPLRVIDDAGSYTEELGQPLWYRDGVDIPCRLDVTRYYRQVTILGQEGIISDFELHVPFDAPLIQDYKIEIDGKFYEVRKLMDAEQWRVTKYALVSRIGIGTSS